MLTEFIHKHPFIGLLVPVMAGIACSEYLGGGKGVLSLSLLLLFFLAVVVLSICYKRMQPFLYPCMVISLFIIALLRSSPPDIPVEEGKTYRIEGICMNVPRPGQYIIKTPHYSLFLPLQDSIPPLTPGEQVAFTATLSPLNIAENAWEFNYDRYLRQQGVLFRAGNISDISRDGTSHNLYTFCLHMQKKLTGKLQLVVQDTTTRHLLQALCLGYRSDVDSYTQSLFQGTGTIHILSVSGLHMGIVYVFLVFLFRLLRVRNKRYDILLIPLIWIYAGVTGLSPPACRAASILTFITLGRLINRDYISLNAVAASAFFTLLISPHLLYSISFQMSYAAYTGIVIILPLLQLKRKKIPAFWRSVYALFAVSLAAQIATLPLTAYYFHSIPLNSILANVIVVPISSLLLYAGIIQLLLPVVVSIKLAFISVIIYDVLLFSLEVFNRTIIHWEELYPTWAQLTGIYLLIVLAVVYFNTRHPRVLWSICVTLFLYLSLTCLHAYRSQHQQELLVYNRYRQSAILLNYHGYYLFLKNTAPDTPTPHYVKANRLKALPSHSRFQNDHIRYEARLLSMPSLSIQIADPQHPEVVTTGILIVTDNLYPSRLPAETPLPRQLIADRSNSRNCIEQWKNWCNRHQIPFIYTGDSGPIRVKI